VICGDKGGDVRGDTGGDGGENVKICILGEVKRSIVGEISYLCRVNRLLAEFSENEEEEKIIFIQLSQVVYL